MGGQWIPSSFVRADELWRHLEKFVDPTDFYSVVAIRRENADELAMYDKSGRKTSKATDVLIEVFAELKRAGEDSAIVAHRGFNQCWITNWTDAESYMKQENDEQDEA